MSRKQELANKGSFTPLVMGNISMGVHTHRFCGSLHELDVLCGYRCPLQVARDCIDDLTTTTQTVTVLRNLFPRCGLPRQLVSDSGARYQGPVKKTNCRQPYTNTSFAYLYVASHSTPAQKASLNTDAPA